MDDEGFRRLEEEIRECRYLSDKVKIMERAELSMSDLTDLLESDCFFTEEFSNIFSSLSDTQLALLTKKLPLDPLTGDFLKEASTRDWQSSLYSFLSDMGSARGSKVFAITDQIADDVLL